MNPHPRLYVTADQLQRLRQRSPLPLLVTAERAVIRSAAGYVRNVRFDYPPDRHNAHLMRARNAQKRVVTLLVRYFQTGQRRYRAAAIAHIQALGAWKYWSWITWRTNDPDPNAIFDLSYGENSATLAIAYDWLHGELSPAERALFLAIARRRSLGPFLRHTATRPGQQPAWWFKHPQSNWNSVCAGGAGLLALALHEELPEARQVLPRVDASLKVFMATVQSTGGAWPEGIGYWNYGMRYAFMYLLSHEHATGRSHPAFRSPATAATLRFPLDFCPNGVPCSFGDVNQWRPMPFHYAAAERLGATDILAALDAQLPVQMPRDDAWPLAAELLLLHPRCAPRLRASRRRVIKLYRHQEWGILADRMPGPNFYLAVRGGTTELPHGHRDLLSFHAVVGDEALIANLSVDEYLDTTFSDRRYEMFETTPPSKNTLFINGVGVTGKSTVATTRLANGIRMDATAAMGVMRDGPAAKFCGRLFLWLGATGALVVDRIELPHVGRVEARFHTFAKVKTGNAWAQLVGRRHQLNVAFACDVPARLHCAVDAFTTPGPVATMLRWCTAQLHTTMTMATLLTPGTTPAKIALTTQGRQIVVTLQTGQTKKRVTLSHHLFPQ